MEADTVLAERIESWFEEATRKGHEQGMQQGEAQVLLRLLTLKFGELDEASRQRIEMADAETLLLWSERILFADTLDKVWG
jgi:flagellar biosynthesis/type III secretory pathway protein FliH